MAGRMNLLHERQHERRHAVRQQVDVECLLQIVSKPEKGKNFSL